MAWIQGNMLQQFDIWMFYAGYLGWTKTTEACANMQVRGVTLVVLLSIYMHWTIRLSLNLFIFCMIYWSLSSASDVLSHIV